MKFRGWVLMLLCFTTAGRIYNTDVETNRTRSVMSSSCEGKDIPWALTTTLNGKELKGRLMVLAEIYYGSCPFFLSFGSGQLGEGTT